MSFDFSKILNNTNKGRGNEAMLLDWLRYNKDREFGSHEIQLDVVLWIRKTFNKTVTPDTISRLWRKMREELKDDKYNSSLFKAGLSVKEITKTKSNQKFYEVTDE
tara:strand:- start:32 stop:349 length:318 start_codon:yes stop_codon:yes gene_type:complete